MTAFLFWFGVVHVAAYAVIGFSLAFTWFVNWTARSYRLKADMLRIYAGILKERKEKRDGPRYPA